MMLEFFWILLRDGSGIHSFLTAYVVTMHYLLYICKRLSHPLLCISLKKVIVKYNFTGYWCFLQMIICHRRPLLNQNKKFGWTSCRLEMLTHVHKKTTFSFCLCDYVYSVHKLCMDEVLCNIWNAFVSEVLQT